MNNKFLKVAMGIVLSATVMSVSAQKTYTSGVASYSTDVRGAAAEAKEYFTPDSTSLVVTFGPGSFKMLASAKHDYVAVALDIPVMQMKKVGVATPSELEEAMAAMPMFTYTTTSETKQISGFNCKKVVAKEAKSGKTYDVWITNDIVVPPTAMPYFYSTIGGYPIQYTSFEQGQEKTITIKSVTDEKAPAGTFSISKDFDKVGSLADLRGGR